MARDWLKRAAIPVPEGTSQVPTDVMLGHVLSLLRWTVSVLFSPTTIVMTVLFLGLGYLYLTRHRSYWKERGVPHLPYRFPFGGAGFEVFRKPVKQLMTDAYREAQEYGGFCPTFDFFGPAVTVRDPALLKAILVKDFDYFTNRQPESFTQSFGMFSKMMVNMRDQEWKEVRNISTPAFSTGKIRQMCQPCERQAVHLAEQICRESSSQQGEIEIRDIMGRYAMDNIASVAFGQEANSIGNHKSVVAAMAAELTQRAPMPRILLTLILLSLPKFLQERIDIAKVTLNNEAIEYFLRIIKQSIRLRAQQTGPRRVDYLQLLLDTRRDDSRQRQLTDDEIVAQCMLFYLAGYDTTSNALTWAARLLAFHPDVQQRLQAEIDEKLPSDADHITFDVVNDMPYLDNVLSETLRLYPVPLLTRCCSRPYQLPGTDVVLPVNCMVYIPTYGLHHDPEWYPEPDQFRPDRFEAAESAGRPPYVYLPFGYGPRNCIGQRFALLQAKLALVAVLRRCSFMVGPRSGGAEPEFVSNTNVLREKGGTWLRVEPRPVL